MLEDKIIQQNIYSSENVLDYYLRFMYDENDNVLGFELILNDGTIHKTIYYVKNFQNDIIKLIDDEGNIVGEYIYDAYGNVININELSIFAYENPFRYKSYFHDQETNLYYCNTRYYSPEICRWISMDEVEYLDASSLLGCNLYAYCLNNPIMNIDIGGDSPRRTLFKIVSVLMSIIVALLSLIVVVDCTSRSEAVSSESLITDNSIVLTQDKNNPNFYSFNYNGTDFSAQWLYLESTWHIENSYLIKNKDDILKICKALHSVHPVPRGDDPTKYRTPEDMAYEWEQHNIGVELCENLSVFEFAKSGIERCKHVDINPGDEGKNVYELGLERLRR